MESRHPMQPLAIVEAQPQPSNHAAKFLVGFVADRANLSALKPLAAEAWLPEQLAIGKHACYLVCAGGVQDSALLKAATKITKQNMTTRNWATVLKLLESASRKLATPTEL